jgi:hypothetical protein
MDKLKDMLIAKADTLIEGKEAFLYVAKWLDLLPPADVVEVVRCKDCIYRIPLSSAYDYKGKPAMTCFNFNRPTREDGYCYEGIKRGDTK